MSKNDHLDEKLCYTIPKLNEIYREKGSHLAWPAPNTLSKWEERRVYTYVRMV